MRATTRRSLRKSVLASVAALGPAGSATQSATTGGRRAQPASRVDYKRIATEEAWTTPDIVTRHGQLIESNPADEPGFVVMGRFIHGRGTESPLIRRPPR